MALPASEQLATISQYLRAEAAASTRHEFHNGEILAMSGGTFEHSVIIANLIRQLGNRLAGTRCRVIESNMRVRAGQGHYVYPDVSILCGPPIFDRDDPNRTTMENPRVVIEVLSDSADAYDRGAKFTLYREIPELEAYILIAQSRAEIELFVRQPTTGWLMSPISGLESILRVSPLQIEVPLSEIYADVVFQPRSA